MVHILLVIWNPTCALLQEHGPNNVRAWNQRARLSIPYHLINYQHSRCNHLYPWMYVFSRAESLPPPFICLSNSEILHLRATKTVMNHALLPLILSFLPSLMCTSENLTLEDGDPAHDNIPRNRDLWTSSYLPCFRRDIPGLRHRTRFGPHNRPIHGLPFHLGLHGKNANVPRLPMSFALRLGPLRWLCTA